MYIDSSCIQPSLNELPVNTSQQNSRKRAGPGNENSDPSVKPPELKQPRKTVEISLPDDAPSEKGKPISVRAASSCECAD